MNTSVAVEIGGSSVDTPNSPTAGASDRTKEELVIEAGHMTTHRRAAGLLPTRAPIASLLFFRTKEPICNVEISPM